MLPITARCLLERPLETASVNRLAIAESWRKEVHSPATHVQKWWAQRLGVVNRYLLMTATSSSQAELGRLSRGEKDLGGLIVYDPFCGSGGVLLEAAKLGAQVIGRDINPVAILATRQALQGWNARELERGLELISEFCGNELTELYADSDGRVIRGYFWVAIAACSVCDERVDLFHRHVFAQHAYPKRHPLAHGICRSCGEVVTVDLSKDEVILCPSCSSVTPFRGPVRSGQGTTGTQFQCVAGHTTRLAPSVETNPIGYRMYAKLYEEEGVRRYARTTEADDYAFRCASARLHQLGSRIVQPYGWLEPGKTTNQVMRVGLGEWRDFYNDRQLLALGLIATAIRDLKIGSAEREALAAAFSKSVEYNNMLCSYKGEGTGAVRGAFHNHTLQFERMPYEANPWSMASGGFLASYRRLRKTLDYKTEPVDLRIADGKVERVIGMSAPVLLDITDSAEIGPNLASVTCGDSGQFAIPDSSVDVVLTDPPHFNKVNYSELADFFHAWLTQIKPFAGYSQTRTTRSTLEVQDQSSNSFEHGLTRVWKEVTRSLKANGIAIFSFHHREANCWKACMNSLRSADLCVTYLEMIKAEMTTSLSKKNQASPHSMDVLVICRKQHLAKPLASDVESALVHARSRIRSLEQSGVAALPCDGRSIVLASVLSLLTNSWLDANADELVDVARTKALEIEEELAIRHSPVACVA